MQCTSVTSVNLEKIKDYVVSAVGLWISGSLNISDRVW